MKKILRQTVSFVLLAAMCLSFSACAKKEPANPNLQITPPKEQQKETLDDVLNKETDTSCLNDEIALPSSSTELSKKLALQALALSSGNDKDKTAELFEKAGFEVILQKNFEKANDDPSNTSAYTLGKKTVVYNGKERTLFAVAVRGTNGGEWYSNFDFAPSKSDEASFAENFLFTAEDALIGISNGIGKVGNPLVLVCGHSRGGATANILALLLNSVCGEENVFAYTFATPATVKDTSDAVSAENVFNFVSTSDVVPKTPLEKWGYKRIGQDVILQGDEDESKRIEEKMQTLYEIAPSISSYYNDRHSLDGKGLSGDGMTTFELMLFISSFAVDATESDDEFSGVSNLSSAFPECDFTPLFEIIDDLFKNDGEKAITVLKNHMPATYAELIEKLN